MQNNTLEKWEEKTLDEVCAFSRGLTYSKKDEVEFSNNIVLRANNIDLVSNSLNFDELKYINSDFVIPEDKKVKENSIMICISSGSKSHLGKVAFIDKDYGYAFGGFMGLITPKEDIIPKYLYYMLVTPEFKDLILHLTDGANINNLKYSDLKDFELRIPSMSEQQRIVGLLDEAFVNIEKAKQNTLQNLNNAKELFNSKIDNIFSSDTSSLQTSIGEIAQIKGGKRVPKGYKLISEKTNHPYIRVTDFNDYGSIDLNDIHYIDDYIYNQIKNYTISSKDLYISIAGTIGKSGIIPNELEGANLTENACKLVLNDNIYNKYIYYFTKTRTFISQTIDNTRTAAMPKLALTRLANIKLPIPPTEEQYQIVQQLDELQEQTKKLEQIYEQKLKDLDELKQSLLQKAFNGEL